MSDNVKVQEERLRIMQEIARQQRDKGNMDIAYSIAEETLRIRMQIEQAKEVKA